MTASSKLLSSSESSAPLLPPGIEADPINGTDAAAAADDNDDDSDDENKEDDEEEEDVDDVADDPPMIDLTVPSG